MKERNQSSKQKRNSKKEIHHLLRVNLQMKRVTKDLNLHLLFIRIKCSRIIKIKSIIMKGDLKSGKVYYLIFYTIK